MRGRIGNQQKETLALLKDDGIYGGLVRSLYVIRELAQKHSTCARRQIGCILLRREGLTLKEMGVGWNGTPFAMEDCRRYRTCPDADTPAGQGAYGRVRCWGLHAEHMAILDAWRKSNGEYSPEDIWACVCTKAPCTTCTAMLMETGCRLIMYEDEPNDNDAAEFFTGVRMTFKQARDHFNG